MIRIFIVLGVVFGIAAGLTFLWPEKSGSVTIVIPRVGVTAHLFEAQQPSNGEPATNSLTKQREIRKVDQDITLELPFGTYLLETDQNDSYEQTTQSFQVDETAVVVEVEPKRTEESLRQELASELPAIQAALNVLTIPANLRVNKGILLGDGSWYTATITPNVSQADLERQYVDYYRIMLRKEGVAWTLITKKPEPYIISRAYYPDIPREIVIKANSLSITSQ
jgi:hypothetical protein